MRVWVAKTFKHLFTRILWHGLKYLNKFGLKLDRYIFSDIKAWQTIWITINFTCGRGFSISVLTVQILALVGATGIAIEKSYHSSNTLKPRSSLLAAGFCGVRDQTRVINKRLSHFQEWKKLLYQGLFWLQPFTVPRILAIVHGDQFITRLIQPKCHYTLRCQVNLRQPCSGSLLFFSRVLLLCRCKVPKLPCNV